jgi:hypothetical protein
VRQNLSVSDRSIVLLLTATIDPGATLMVARHDPLVRLADYMSALGAWLSSGAAPRVVFCENSGYDLAPLQRLVSSHGNHKVELISFSGNEPGATRGKGYSELKLIDHALKESSLLAASDVIVKCTGRLTVRNGLDVLHAVAKSDFDVMCSLKQHLSWADSRLFAATPAFFNQYLLPRIDMIDDRAGVNFEHALACAITRAVADRKQWRPFPIFPRIDGISGSDGKVMTNSPVTSVAKALYHRLRNFVYQH